MDTTVDLKAQILAKTEQIPVSADNKTVTSDPVDSERSKGDISNDSSLEFVSPAAEQPSKKSKRKKDKRDTEKQSDTSKQAPVRSKQAPALTSHTQRAPAGSSLAGMVSDLKTKAEDEKLMSDPDFAGWLPPKGETYFAKFLTYCVYLSRYLHKS